jgi:hypothetical protein
MMLVITMTMLLFAACRSCNGQVKYYQIEAIKELQPNGVWKYSEVYGTIAATREDVYITIDGERVCFNVKKVSEVRAGTIYRLSNKEETYDGYLAISEFGCSLKVIVKSRGVYVAIMRFKSDQP